MPEKPHVMSSSDRNLIFAFDLITRDLHRGRVFRKGHNIFPSESNFTN